jgi:hypothetical protein
VSPAFAGSHGAGRSAPAHGLTPRGRQVVLKTGTLAAGHFLLGSAPDEFRFSRASSWTFFISVCSGLQQTSHKSALSSGMSCLPSLTPLMLTCAHPRLLSDSRKQQSQTKVVFVPILQIRRTHGRAARKLDMAQFGPSDALASRQLSMSWRELGCPQRAPSMKLS